jgi:NAD(P)-dependent dehydrogenase (short-subunit alcohol dehydrogenase family)
VNLTGPVFLTQAFARALPEGVDGAVINVTDWRTLRPYPDHFSYVVAKGGLDTFTRAAAEALAPRIRVNAVALGAILPPSGKDLIPRSWQRSRWPRRTTRWWRRFYHFSATTS